MFAGFALDNITEIINTLKMRITAFLFHFEIIPIYPLWDFSKYTTFFMFSRQPY